MAQEKGFVSEYLETIVNVKLLNGNEIECALDTGFNGALMLPRTFVEENAMPLIGREPVLMVEQNSIEVDFVTDTIKWLGQEIIVQIIVSETGEALMGTQMLVGSLLEIDYENLTVKITK